MSESWNLLEWSFVGLLALMTIGIGAFSVFVVARLVEPRGVRALLKRIAGK